MQYKYTINEQMPNLNDLIKWERTQFRTRTGAFMTKGSQEKKKWQKKVIAYIRRDLGRTKITKPVVIRYKFFEPNKKRDLDNCASFAMKINQDALVESGVLENDGWANIIGFTCDFDVDKNNPRIEVTLDDMQGFDYNNATDEQKLAYTE